MNILVLVPANDEHKATLEAAAPEASFVYTSPDAATDEEVAAADVIVGNLAADRLGTAARLRLIQLSSAGYDDYVAAGTLPAGAALCCATGAYGQAVSEHLFASVLAVMKKLPGYRDLQRSRRWGDLGEVRSPAGANVLVLGAGDIGTHIATLFAAVGSHVTGVRRNSVAAETSFERMATIDELTELLPEADVVASVLPSTPQTRGLADASFFARMKEGSIFANAGRGDLVNQSALLSALQSGHLAGAALDVCTPEPLPGDDALWTAPNLLLTPHVSGFYHLPVTLDNIVSIAAGNIRALLSGDELRNRVL
ncbi:D-2-hydroxyacid dehydrogenase [Paratractidigestivibacter sp.]|uniref:D-2-hydroxyacid dehydrogenase n=1 Tax=Paratractidigestivibacter sp. TaxID=2847316 RepID=UPI003AB8BECB